MTKSKRRRTQPDDSQKTVASWKVFSSMVDSYRFADEDRPGALTEDKFQGALKDHSSDLYRSLAKLFLAGHICDVESVEFHPLAYGYVTYSDGAVKKILLSLIAIQLLHSARLGTTTDFLLFLPKTRSLFRLLFIIPNLLKLMPFPMEYTRLAP